MKPNLKLKVAIAGSGKKQRRIATLASIGEIRLSQIVRGHRPPKDEEIERLARVLGVPREELLP